MRGNWSSLRRATPARANLLAKRNCAGWQWPPKNTEKISGSFYAELEEFAGWGGAEVVELREEKWDRVLAAFLSAAGKTREMRCVLPRT